MSNFDNTRNSKKKSREREHREKKSQNNKETGKEKRNDTERINDQIKNEFSNKERVEEIRNPFVVNSDKDKSDERGKDFYYLTSGFKDANVRLDSDKGFSIDIESTSRDWLEKEIKPRVEKILGKQVKVKPREGRNTYRLNFYGKDFVKDIHAHQNNPDLLDKMDEEQLTEWVIGNFDSKGTINATEIYAPTILIPDDNIKDLERMQQSMETKGISSKLEKPKNKMPRLKIQGSKNFKLIRDNYPFKNPEKAEQHKDLIDKAEKFEDPNRFDYANQRAQCGYKFEDLLKEVIPFIRPNSEEIKLDDPYNEDGKFMDPDTAVRNPDGRIEIIEGKISDKAIEEKDEKYVTNNQADFETIYHLEGEEKSTNKEYGKEINYRNSSSLIKEIENARDKEKSEETKEWLDSKINDIKELKEKSEKIRDNHFKSDVKASEPIPGLVDLDGNFDSSDHIHDVEDSDIGDEGENGGEEEEKGGGGKEEKHHPIDNKKGKMPK